ncbi:hypothetical protein KSX_34740 [Ktedonospora formicarum]|uniref:Diguanylate cyclase n=1 Tax=Ktedonospora formicarum TaxID=2778364 RepID=A0A8J3MSY0_9CHLR|nr:hypothetical protein KSX_34740 [Ktedonospora formicarum]
MVQSQQRLLLEQDRLFREQRRLNLTDVTTGLPNRCETITRLETALAHCRVNKDICAIFFVNLDHFKRVNDTWGHWFGDAVLSEAGARLARAMGEEGVVGCYGGDEFVAFQVGLNASQAHMRAESLRQHILEESCVGNMEKDARALSVSVSIGISLYPLHAIKGQELIAFANEAMYRAKSRGRNCVCMASPGDRLPNRDVVERAMKLSDVDVMTLRALLALLEARDLQTYLHGQRMVDIVVEIARYLHCRSEDIYTLRLAAMLHDLGKISIPDSILHKAGPLDRTEWVLMQQHPRIGQEILVKAGGVFSVVAVVAGAHHERWDGSGYPAGLEREEIPLLARILSVADTYDTMVSARIYHQPLSSEAACAELVRCMGTKFDPLVVRAFLAVLPRILQESMPIEHVEAFDASRHRDER